MAQQTLSENLTLNEIKCAFNESHLSGKVTDLFFAMDFLLRTRMDCRPDRMLAETA
jgi:hypothetical protein